MAILPPAAFLATVAGLAMHPSIALAVVAVACIGVPALGALAIAVYARGGRPARALLVLPLLVLAALHAGGGRGRRARLVMLAAWRSDRCWRPRRGARARGRALLVAGWTSRQRGIRIATAALLDARAGRMPDFAQPVLGA